MQEHIRMGGLGTNVYKGYCQAAAAVAQTQWKQIK